MTRQDEINRRRILTVTVPLKRMLTLRGAIAVALIFWCAGTGCMMVSYARASMSDADASAQTADQPMTGMSAAMDSHACCKAKHKALSRVRATKPFLGSDLSEFTLPEPVSSDAMSCCPLTSGSMVVASRSQTNDNASEFAQTDSSSLKLENSRQTPVAIPLRLANRAGSYLLDCAFLI